MKKKELQNLIDKLEQFKLENIRLLNSNSYSRNFEYFCIIDDAIEVIKIVMNL